MENNIALTIEQMNHIASFGVDTRDASMGHFLYRDYDYYPDSNYFLGVASNRGGFDLEHGDIPAYTLEDLIKHMPRIRNYLPFDLHMCAGKSDEEPEWMCVYEPFDIEHTTSEDWIKFTDKSPLMAVYKMYIYLLNKFGIIQAHQWYHLDEPKNEPNKPRKTI